MFRRNVILAINSNLKRWRLISIELIPGGVTRNWFVDSISISICDEEDHAKELLSIVSKIIKYSGGGIARIVSLNILVVWNSAHSRKQSK